jgi:hypothetical protein
MEWNGMDEVIRQAVRFKAEHLEEFLSDEIAGRRSIEAMRILVDQHFSESIV